MATIDPEIEYQNARKIIEQASIKVLDSVSCDSLKSSVEKLITTTRVLIEREERRRGKKKDLPKDARPKGRKKGQDRSDSKKLPSERYPGLEVEQHVVKQEHPPLCPCCNEPMKESGLFDTSEKLEVVPARYYIKRESRVKYNCGTCHGSMVNTAASPSIVPTSNYADSLIIDVSLSKYCDLIPIERYVQIAFRAGLEGLPAQSMIGLTHQLANFLRPIYKMIKNEILRSKVVHIDETTHRMLEGDETSNWYLWGFFIQGACYYETHGTRSGDVPVKFLKDAEAEFILTDGYSGYNKAQRVLKKKHGRDLVLVLCNAHAYRYFETAAATWKEEAEVFLKLYGDIYTLERLVKKPGPIDRVKLRKDMQPLFEQLKKESEKTLQEAMPESSLLKAVRYFLNHYEGLTLCTEHIELELDNNLGERQLRAPVVGRKTWLGTHSKRGANTAAVLFTIVQSCKINNVNPRSYVPWIVEKIHTGADLLTPSEYSKLPP